MTFCAVSHGHREQDGLSGILRIGLVRPRDADICQQIRQGLDLPGIQLQRHIRGAHQDGGCGDVRRLQTPEGPPAPEQQSCRQRQQDGQHGSAHQ